MDDKVAEEIKMHQETISTDSNTPLQLIREKELEISGQVLAAKRQADEIVADARKRAGAIVKAAEDEGSSVGAEREAAIRAEAEAEAKGVRAQADQEAEALRSRVQAHTPEAVALVLDTVARV